jgi:hypothetical protein
MSTTPRFSVSDPSEKLTLTFDFTNGLATGETLGSASVVVTLDNNYGTDSSPQAIVSASTVSGNYVLVAISGQFANNDYHIHVTVTTSNPNKILANAKVLPVRNL